MNQAYLQRKIQNAQSRIWIDEEAHPFPVCHCWCSGSIELDYSQGFELMTSRLNAFLNAHIGCLPDEYHSPGEEQSSIIEANLCYSCCVAPRQPGSVFCKECQQERDDELQDFYDSQWSEPEGCLPGEYRSPRGEQAS